ncbi:ATP12 family chaperone protein [Oceaniglobus roseus]|uniref:ATP12 family chaperone protein n=1 Tax=Oceaniglobus roseus TaxID=1737570 RepID=UPI000C7F1739|nr:ATP12 family protein [Kandeliimicrobium roseum]
MAEWTAKRFWTDVTVEDAGTGWTIRLDGRPVKTPLKAEVVVPTRPLAEAMADEWRAQGERIDPLSMPVTRSANAALDKVAPQRAAVEEMIAAYAGSDLLCYRAATPLALAERQARHWTPLLDWAAERHGAPLAITEGVMPVAQPAESLAALARAMEPMSAFQIAAFHDLVGLSGSYVLGLAVAERHLSGENAWSLSRLDEDWQAEQWGRDEEAEEAAAIKRTAFLHAESFYHGATRD